MTKSVISYIFKNIYNVAIIKIRSLIYKYCHALCSLNLMGQKTSDLFFLVSYLYMFCSTADVDLKEGFDATFASYYIWPARMSRSIRSALYVPGSSLKSSLNMEYALPKKDAELIQFLVIEREESYASRILSFCYSYV